MLNTRRFIANHRRTHVRAGTCATAVLVLAGCSPTADDAGQTPSIGFLQLASAAYTNAIRTGVEQAAAAGGYQVTTFDAGSDPQKQVAQCQDAVSSGRLDGLVIEPVDGATLAGCVASAVAAGMQVSVLESAIGPDPSSPEIQVDGIAAQLVLRPSDLALASAEMAAMACQHLNPCDVAYSIADPAAQILVEQKDATVAALAEHSNISVVAEVNGGYDNPAQGRAAVQDAHQAHGGIDVVIGDDDVTMQGINRWVVDEGLQGKVATIGNGATEASVASIRSGAQFGTIVLYPRTAGARATEYLLKAIGGESGAPISETWAEFSPLGPGQLVLTRSNVDAFQPEF
ncbi:sugar ABC transporter substrate-binding protein [Mycobacterium sp. NPDC003323]